MVKVTMNPQSLLLTPNIFVEDLFDDSFQFGGKEGQLELQFLQQNVLIITVVRGSEDYHVGDDDSDHCNVSQRWWVDEYSAVKDGFVEGVDDRNVRLEDVLLVKQGVHLVLQTHNLHKRNSVDQDIAPF